MYNSNIIKVQFTGEKKKNWSYVFDRSVITVRYAKPDDALDIHSCLYTVRCHVKTKTFWLTHQNSATFHNDVHNSFILLAQTLNRGRPEANQWKFKKLTWIGIWSANTKLVVIKLFGQRSYRQVWEDNIKTSDGKRLLRRELYWDMVSTMQMCTQFPKI
jgi:hypothetical protein